MKILIIGKYGQLARCLDDKFIGSPEEIIFSSSEDLDISDFEKTNNKLKKINPNIVINTSAYTAVDKAESDTDSANLINHLSVNNMAKICEEIDCSLIHISTDYVFDGKGERPFKENNLTNPSTVYGKTKLDGEKAILNSGCKHIILRTAWLFSCYGKNFLKTMLQLSLEKDELNIVGDQVGCPTNAHDLAKAIITIIPFLNDLKYNGIYHFGGSSSCSWAEFAEEIFNVALTEKKIRKKPMINIINSTESSAIAKRPLNSRIDSSLFKKRFNFPPSDWKKGVQEVIRALPAEEEIKDLAKNN